MKTNFPRVVYKDGRFFIGDIILEELQLENFPDDSEVREKVKHGLDKAKEKIISDFLDSFNKVKK